MIWRVKMTCRQSEKVVENVFVSDCRNPLKFNCVVKKQFYKSYEIIKKEEKKN